MCSGADGGGRGIRTHVEVFSPLHDFQSCRFSHSRIPPRHVAVAGHYTKHPCGARNVAVAGLALGMTAFSDTLRGRSISRSRIQNALDNRQTEGYTLAAFTATCGGCSSMAERLTVTQDVVGSRPISHPTTCKKGTDPYLFVPFCFLLPTRNSSQPAL